MNLQLPQIFMFCFISDFYCPFPFHILILKARFFNSGLHGFAKMFHRLPQVSWELQVYDRSNLINGCEDWCVVGLRWTKEFGINIANEIKDVPSVCICIPSTNSSITHRLRPATTFSHLLATISPSLYMFCMVFW